MLYPDDEEHLKIAQMLQEFWKALNIRVTIEGITYDQLINERLSNRDYQAALVDLNLSRSPDPDPYPFWDTAMAENGQNYTKWDNRIASEYLEQARITVYFFIALTFNPGALLAKGVDSATVTGMMQQVQQIWSAPWHYGLVLGVESLVMLSMGIVLSTFVWKSVAYRQCYGCWWHSCIMCLISAPCIS